MPSSSRCRPPPIPELGTRHGLHLPPAGPRRQRPRGADRRAQPAAGHGLAKQGAGAACAPTAWKTRRSCSSTSTATRRNALGVSFDADQQRALDRAGLDLRQRLPEPRPPAARGGAGRRAGAHAAGRPAAPERAQRPGQAGAAVGLRHARAGSPARCRPCATTATRRCASPATPRRATAPARRWPRWKRWRRKLPPGFGFEWTGQSREEKLAGAQAMASCTASRSWRCSCAWPRCTRAGRSRWR